MGRRYLEIRGVKVDGRGRRYADVTSDEAEAAGMSVLVPLVLVKGEPKSATRSVASAISAVATPRVRNIAYMHDGTTVEFASEYGEQMGIACSRGEVDMVRSAWLAGDEQPDDDSDDALRAVGVLMRDNLKEVAE